LYPYDPPTDPYLTILYQDEDILVLDKPSGLLSVPGKAVENKDSLASRAQEQFPESSIVHRLDMPTSGVMVMAMNHDTNRYLGKQFQLRKVEKSYIARVWGHIEGNEGQIDLPLRCDWPNRPRQIVCYEHGKPSQTDWRVMEREAENNITRVSLSPLTGRSHQLRVHMMTLGHPILGDELYAEEDAFNAAPRLQLHAHTLSFTHPRSGDIMTFEAPLPF
jgi:tRNA pseudouridine32 synthase/23S rRNA pseudouridine746 synthase